MNEGMKARQARPARNQTFAIGVGHNSLDWFLLVMCVCVCCWSCRNKSCPRGTSPTFRFLNPTLKTDCSFRCSIARLTHSPHNYQPWQYKFPNIFQCCQLPCCGGTFYTLKISTLWWTVPLHVFVGRLRSQSSVACSPKTCMTELKVGF